MKAIIIAAGMSKRLRPLTDKLPKCLLKIGGTSIIEQAMGHFKNNGVADISVIRGYLKDKIQFEGLTYYENTDFENNNILHSLMHAREKIEQAIQDNVDMIVTYSDITFDESVLQKLLATREPVSVVVDTDWHWNYEGRTDHTPHEAENVVFDENGGLQKIGKNVFTEGQPKDRQGEFIGMWKFTPEGAKVFLQHFDRLNASLQKTDPYQNTKEWQKSYMTDIFQEMLDKGEKIHCTVIERGWKEFDTVQDFKMVGGDIPEEYAHLR